MFAVASGFIAARVSPLARVSPGRSARGKAVVPNVGRSGVNELTGESEWIEVSDASAALADAQELYERRVRRGGDHAGGRAETRRQRHEARPPEARELSLGEQQACFYNLTCAHSRLGDVDKALKSLELTLRAGYGSAQLYGFGRANEDYERLMRDEGLEAVRADARFKQLVDQFNVEPSELQLQLDPSQSVIGRAMKMWGSKK